MIFIVIIVHWSVFELVLLEKSNGFVSFQVTGDNAYEKFKNESGGIRWQREHNGRYQTSTITVAVLSEDTHIPTELKESELEWKTCRGSGNGGQNVNKRDTAIWLIHKPTGIQVRSEEERSQYQNKVNALRKLEKRLKDSSYVSNKTKLDQERKGQVGRGESGDKIRTIRVRDNNVTNHLNGKKMRYEDYCRGMLSKLV